MTYRIMQNWFIKTDWSTNLTKLLSVLRLVAELVCLTNEISKPMILISSSSLTATSATNDKYQFKSSSSHTVTNTESLKKILRQRLLMIHCEKLSGREENHKISDD